ncbi:MAG: hypothetical protein R3345_01965 [Fulvivirga sp.]|nr:hypothetical protein [Fulvivirga sp.]
MRISVTLFLVLSLYGISTAQPGYNWPEDEAQTKKAKEKIALYSDALKADDYNTAAQNIDWLLENTPDLNESIYINGVKIYEELAEKTTEKEQKRAYQEKVLQLYDDRVKYFNDEINVLNRKAFAVYRFYKNRKDKYEEMYKFFEEVMDKSGTEFSPNLLVAYMDVIRRYKATSKAISDTDVIDKYDKVMSIIDAQAEKGKDTENIQNMVDKLLAATVTVDCDFISNNLAPKLDEAPNDLGLAKKIMGLSLAANCSKLPAFIRAAKIVQEQEPDFGVAKVIGIRSAAEGDIQTAMKYFEQAVELAPDEQKKANIYLEMAQQYSKMGQRANARSYAYKAINADQSVAAKGYKLIGDLYFNSFDVCKEGVSRVEDRAVYLIAYDMYEKAGNQSMMQQARAQFPSIGEIFELNLEEGSTINVGCWINGTTVLRRRPE